MLAPLSDFLYSSDVLHSKELTKKSYFLSDITDELNHAIVELKDDEARGALILFKKVKKAEATLTLISFTSKVVLCPSVSYQLHEVKIRVSALVNERWPTS